MKILISTSLLSPYRVDWLDELGKYAEIDILCLEETCKDRNQKWLEKKPKNSCYELMQGCIFPKIGKISFSLIHKLKNSKYDIIILDGYGFATQIINMLYLNSKKRTYLVNVDGIISKKENKFIKFIKQKLLSNVPYFLCGSVATNRILKEYKVSEERIINHPFTSLFEQDIFKNLITKKKKEQLKIKLGIKEKRIIISVGRFSYLNGYGKGYDVLLKTAHNMSADFGWYIVGGKPTNEFEKMLIEFGLNNVHFIEHLDKENLREYYMASDIFVLMTVGDTWGLVINEAMACGLPVITTEKCMAGLDLIKDGTNGYIIPTGSTKMLEDSIKKIVVNNVDDAMSISSLNTIKPYTIENMAKKHIEAFNKILSKR